MVVLPVLGKRVFNTPDHGMRPEAAVGDAAPKDGEALVMIYRILVKRGVTSAYRSAIDRPNSNPHDGLSGPGCDSPGSRIG